jgi:NADH dehydrogenase
METIVIVGGGAGGLELATRLGDTLGKSKRSRMLLVDRWPGHFWKPLLHTVASGKCDPQVSELFSAQALDHDFEFVQGDMLCMDRAHRTITLSPRDGGDGACRVIAYDKLVLALGSVTNFFGVPGAQDTRSRWTAWPMRSISAAASSMPAPVPASANSRSTWSSSAAAPPASNWRRS